MQIKQEQYGQLQKKNRALENRLQDYKPRANIYCIFLHCITCMARKMFPRDITCPTSWSALLSDWTAGPSVHCFVGGEVQPMHADGVPEAAPLDNVVTVEQEREDHTQQAFPQK